MIKKTLLILALILPMLANAQSVGTWKIYSTYSGVDKIIESPSRVYYMSSGSLYSYNPDTEENIVYDTSAGLTESSITDVYYNPFANYLAIAYSSGNIDLLYDSTQRVVNMSDIKDAVVNTSHTINDIDFAPGKLIAATAFGLVIFDDKKHEVTESGIYNINVPSATFFGDNPAMVIDKTLYYLPSGKKINNINNFLKTTIEQTYSKMRGLSSDKGVFSVSLSTGEYPRRLTVNESTGLVLDSKNMANLTTVPLRNKDGLYFSSATDKKLYHVSVETFDNPTNVALQDNVKSDKYGFYSDITKPWKGNAEGVGKYDVASSAFTVNPVQPNGLTFPYGVGRITAHPEGGVIVLPYGGTNMFHTDWGLWNTTKYSNLNFIKDGIVTDITPDNYEGYTQKNNGNARISFNPVYDPEDPDYFYVSLTTDGVYKIKGDKQVTHYDYTNSALIDHSYIGTNAQSLGFDGHNNLWVTQNSVLVEDKNEGEGRRPLLSVMSAEGRKKAVPDKNDWNSYYNKNFNGGWDMPMLVCKKSNMIFLTQNNNNEIVVADTKGLPKLDNSNVEIITSFVDQDNKTINVDDTYLTAFFEDHLGRVWLGTSGGVYVITDPSTFMQNHKAHHIKVPRNDGTNYADYLIDSDHVLCFDEDSSGRMWIATQNSGVYLINSDLTNIEIIANYNMSNSPLMSNKIYAVRCDKQTNEVFFGMVEGLVSYMSDASYSAEDYSNVVIYPNPVRPDFNGWVTIKGLMDNSLVKITDQAGNQLFQGTSNGGMISWDACDSRGERVKTGVYYVFASQNSNGSSSGDMVGKILVVK